MEAAMDDTLARALRRSNPGVRDARPIATCRKLAGEPIRAVRRVRFAALLACPAAGAVALQSPAHAADSSKLGTITLRPTIHAMGVRAAIEGDDNANAAVAVAFKKSGGSAVMQGPPLVRASGPRGLGSLFFLEPDTEYTVTLTLTDPDNAGPVEASAAARTRRDAPPAATGQHRYVNAGSGADSNDGSQGHPFKTIQRAVGQAGPGVTIHVASGVYREAVTVSGSHGGAPDKPLWIVADPGAVLDGSDPALEDGSAFQLHGGAIWSAPLQGECRYVAAGDTRLYDYASLADLQNGAAGLPGGFFVDSAASRLYIRLPDDSSPAGKPIHVARLGVGFLLDTVSDVVIEGFELRYFGTVEYSGVGIDVRDTSRAWIRKNAIHHMNEGVRVRRPNASDNVVELNSIRDTSVWGWPWDAVKAHTPEASAVSITGAAGNIVRRNTMSGSFNGVDVGSFGDPSEAIAPDTDVYENTLSQHGDDGLEPEGACVNVRFWNNAIRGVLNGISLSPIRVGPVFAIRTLVDGYKAHALKVNNGPTGWMLVYHTTAVPAAPSDAQAMAPPLAFARFVARNNIWQAHRYVIESSVTPSGPVDLDYDDLYTDSADGTPRFVKWLDVRYASLAELKASNTIEQHGFQIAPAYENAAAGDFTPVAGSGVLDVGQVLPGINDRWIVGAGPDLGAFERGGVGPSNDGGAGAAGAADGGGGSGGGQGGTGGGGGSGGGPGADSGSAQGGTPPEASSDGGGGCGCSAPGKPARSSALLIAAAALVAGAARRKGRAPRPASRGARCGPGSTHVDAGRRTATAGAAR
jgi:hypothetical protein